MEQTTIPTYNKIIKNGKWDFLQKIEREETIDEKTGEKTINFIENPNTGGEFVIHDKNNNELGKLYLYQGKLYIVNDNNNTQNITLLNTNTFEDLENLKNTYDIYYIDKEKSDELQKVSIENENDIQVDRGIVLSFDKIDSKNPNSELYLWGIYNGEFKEVTEEVVDPETKEKTTETKKLLTGYANIFYQNGNITIQGSLENGLFKQGKDYREDGTLWLEGTFTKNEDGYTVLHGDDCKRYYENGKLWQEGTFIDNKLNGDNCIEYYENGETIICEGKFENGAFKQGKLYRKDGTLWQEGDFILNEQDYIVLNGDNCKKYYEDGEIKTCEGAFKNGVFKRGKYYRKDGTLWQEGTFENNLLTQGKYYRKDGTLWQEGTFTKNEDGYTVLDGDDCKEYYEDGETVKYKGKFENDVFKQGKYYREDGILCQKGTLKNGMLNGEGKWYYKNGTLWQEGTFKDDELNGEGKLYYEDGTLWQEGTFKDDKLNGENCIEYYENGEIKKYEGAFKNGVFKQGKYYREDGTLWYEGTFTKSEYGYTVLHGYNCKEYYEDGKLRQEGTLKNGMLNGEGKWYYKNGTLWQDGTFKDDKLNGEGKLYYEDGTLWQDGTFKDDKLNGEGKWYYEDGTLWQEGTFEDNKLNGEGKLYYEDGTLWLEGTFENDVFKRGKWYRKNGTLWSEGTFTKNKEGYIALNGDDCKDYHPIIIQQGQFKDGYLYSGSVYLRDNPTSKSIEKINNEQINSENKIYTLERDEENLDKRIITYYGKAIGLEDDIKLQMTVGKDNIVTLRLIKNGEILTDTQKIKEIINKLKQFFNNIPKEQLKGFDDYLATLYYTTIMNKEEYKDTNILIPDLCEYYFKTNKEVEQTLNLINQIPQDKRKGKYIIPCDWLENKHQVNLRIDFDNNICEIVNAGGYAFVDEKVINNLQKELKKQFDENWVVYENHIVHQSIGNCTIASNIVATEKTVIEGKVKEYNKKKEELSEINKKININDEQKKQNLQKELQESLNTIINNNNKDTQQTITVEELEQQVQSLSNQYNDEIEQIVINEILYNDLRNKVEELKKEKQGQIITEELLKKEVLQKKSIEERIEEIKKDTERLKIKKENFVRYNLISKERLFNEFDKQFNEKLSNNVIERGYLIRSVL